MIDVSPTHTNSMNRDLMMKRFLTAAPAWIFLRRAAIMAACLGLAIVVGCKQEGPPKATTPAPSESATKPQEEKAKGEAKSLSGREVLNRMAAAYRKASTYADAGTVRLMAEAGDKKIDDTANFSVTLVRPNKVRLQAYEAMLVCDGQKMYAAIEDLPRQVLVRHGDVVVWGGPARLTFHGVQPLAEGSHPLTGNVRYNLTFRRAG